MDGLSTKIGDIKRDNEKLASCLNRELERLKAGKKTFFEQLSKYDTSCMLSKYDVYIAIVKFLSKGLYPSMIQLQW